MKAGKNQIQSFYQKHYRRRQREAIFDCEGSIDEGTLSPGLRKLTQLAVQGDW